MQTITRKGSFDAAHRVMNEKMKCFNIHGHTYLYELTFNCLKIKDIGYSIDFKEIKRVAMQWIDDAMDHAVILNPQDEKLLTTANALKSKMWIMSLNRTDYCNPTVENIAKELWCAVEQLTKIFGQNLLELQQIRLYETPNCFTDIFAGDLTILEYTNWMAANGTFIKEYAKLKGILEYDDRVK